MSAKTSLSICVGLGVILAGCAENLQRTDTIDSFAGDSVARNIAIQTIDPTPYRARYRHIHHNGKRLTDVMKIYEEPSKAPKNKVTGTGINKL